MGSSKEEIFITVIAGTITFLILAIFIIVFVLLHKKRQRKNKMEKAQLRSRFDQELLRTQLEIQEQTLRNISQEIHDNIGQMLSLAKLNLALAEENGDARISNSHQLVSKAIQDLRDLSKSLHTDYIAEMGLQRAIEREVEMISKTGIIVAKLEVKGQPRRLDSQKELILFRIVQESVTNVIKHAAASAITITVDYSLPYFLLNVHDNGKGIEAVDNKDPHPDGIGVRSMQHRAQLIGGIFELHSVPGNGTTITIQLPNHFSHE
jgi:two-component system, NarL family, sensor kinase